MKRNYLDNFTTYCMTNEIRDWDDNVYKKKYAFIRLSEALNFNTIYEIIMMTKDWNQFVDVYRWCFPYADYLQTIGWSYQKWLFITERKMKEVWDVTHYGKK